MKGLTAPAVVPQQANSKLDFKTSFPRKSQPLMAASGDDDASSVIPVQQVARAGAGSAGETLQTAAPVPVVAQDGTDSLQALTSSAVVHVLDQPEQDADQYAG